MSVDFSDMWLSGIVITYMFTTDFHCEKKKLLFNYYLGLKHY